MENKKKPSILKFVPSHDDFENPGTVFNPEMLKWPFFNSDGSKQINDDLIIGIHRNAIEALTTIYPFEVKISLGINLKENKLFLTKKTWGEIYQNERSIFTFSHDTRYGSSSIYTYNSLLDWPEVVKYSDEIPRYLYMWTVEDWADFFGKRILGRAMYLRTKAINMKNEAASLDNSAHEMLLALIQ